MQNYVIRNLLSKDMIEVCQLHIRAFPSDHFTSHFTQNLLLKYFRHLNFDNKFNFVIYNGDESLLLGYLIAGEHIQSILNKFKVENYYNIFLVLLKNPRFLFEKVFLTIKKFLIQKKSKAKFRVFIFVTNPEFQRKGIGELLLKRLEQDLRKIGTNCYGLSVRTNNDRAINFYNKNSFVKEFSSLNSIYFIKYL